MRSRVGVVLGVGRVLGVRFCDVRLGLLLGMVSAGVDSLLDDRRLDDGVVIVGRGIVLRDRGRSFGAEELRETQLARGGPLGRLLRSGGGCSDGGRVRGRNLGCDDRNGGRADALLLTRLTAGEGRDAEVHVRVGARKVMDDDRIGGTRQRCDVLGRRFDCFGCLDASATSTGSGAAGARRRPARPRRAARRWR